MKWFAWLLMLWALALPAQERKQKVRGPRLQAEITLRLIEANSAANMPNDAGELVPAELKQLLRFNRYHLVDSGFIRGVAHEDLTLALAGNLTCRVTFHIRESVSPTELEYARGNQRSPAGKWGSRETSENRGNGKKRRDDRARRFAHEGLLEKRLSIF